MTSDRTIFPINNENICMDSANPSRIQKAFPTRRVRKSKNITLVMEDTALHLRHRLPETSATKAVAVDIPESSKEPTAFLPQTWSVSALEVWKALARRPHNRSTTISKSVNASSCATPTINEETLFMVESDNRDQCLSFNSSATSQLVLDRIMSQSVRSLTSTHLRKQSSVKLATYDLLFCP